MPSADDGVLESDEATLIRSMWESAVISYGRCFEEGKGHLTGRSRARVPQDIVDDLPAEYRVTHLAVIEERSKHIAHRVNRLQQAQVLVALADPDEERGVATMTTMLLHQVVRRDLPEPLLTLAEHLAFQMRSRIVGARDRIAGEWNCRLDEAYSRARREAPTIDLGGTGSVATVVFAEWE